jgi:hypothetical protein
MTDHRDIGLVTCDGSRYDHVPVHGYDRETSPTVTAIAGDGSIFEDARLPAVGPEWKVPHLPTGDRSAKSLSGESWTTRNRLSHPMDIHGSSDSTDLPDDELRAFPDVDVETLGVDDTRVETVTEERLRELGHVE